MPNVSNDLSIGHNLKQLAAINDGLDETLPPVQSLIKGHSTSSALDEIKEARVATTALPEQQIELDKVSKQLGAVFLAPYRRRRQVGGSAHLFERPRRERHGGAQGGRCLSSLPCARPRAAQHQTFDTRAALISPSGIYRVQAPS